MSPTRKPNTGDRLLAILKDGKPHRYRELKATLDDELAGKSALYFHLSVLRDRLEGTGLTVLFTPKGHGPFYTLVRTVDADAVDAALKIAAGPGKADRKPACTCCPS